jgi:hypothetical protein
VGCRGYRLVANSRAAKQRKCSSLTKVRLLPFQKVVVVFEYFKLLNFAGTATIEDNVGNPSALRDVRSAMVDHMRCHLCLRYRGVDPDGPRYACICGLDNQRAVAAPGTGDLGHRRILGHRILGHRRSG